jgi:dATP pyrophosphohydrolase
VTGSQHEGETLELTAVREVAEETGLTWPLIRSATGSCRIGMNLSEWRWRYPKASRKIPNTCSGCSCLRRSRALAPREHLAFSWLPWEEAAQRCFSWSNAAAIRELPKRIG